MTTTPTPPGRYTASSAATSAITTGIAPPVLSVSKASEVNKLRIVHVTNRLAMHFQDGFHSDRQELFHLLYALARGIDYAVSHNDVAPNAHDLPPLVKKVYRLKDEGFLQAAITVLFISIKNACNKSWFQTAESNELLKMTNEMSSIFAIGDSIISESNTSLQVVQQINSRYFPQIKCSYLLASFEVKGGYEVLLVDIFVPRNIAPEERIRLFVAQSDNMTSSTCIISPSQVNFFVNGKGVEKRTNVTMDNGPQFPTDITKMLKYGLNLFQVVGYFKGNHVIAIAVMRAANISNVPELQDYVQPDIATVMSDTVTEEGSRLSLNCPISFKRIKTPVKGRFCRHHQCFDFKNYMELNSRKPSWHCPTCNQSASYTDIRIDQNMAKILQEAGHAVTDVIISADGTWKVCEGVGHENNPAQVVKHALASCHEDPTPKSTVTANNSTVIVDLTCEDGFDDNVTTKKSTSGSLSGKRMLEGNNPCESVDRRPSQDECGLPPESCRTPSIQVHQQISRETLSRSSLNSTLPTRIHRQTFPSPVIAGTCIAPIGNDQSRQYVPQIRSSDLQLQQQVGSCTIGNEAQRQTIPRHVTRTPVAVQALPASQNQNNSKRPRVGELDFTPRSDTSSSLPISQTLLRVSTSNAVNSGMETSLFSRAAGLSSLVQHPSLVQPSSTQPRSQVVGLAACQVNSSSMSDNFQTPNGQSIHSHLSVKNSQSEHLNPHQTMTQLLNRVSQLHSRPPAWTPQASRNATGNLANQQSPLSTFQHVVISARMQPGMPSPSARVRPLASMITAPPQMAVSRGGSSTNEQQESHGSQQTVTSASLPELPSDTNWKPTGRMRGSLSGAAYSAAISHYISQPPGTQAAASGSSTPSQLPNTDRVQK